jgi:hypothetical protein
MRRQGGTGNLGSKVASLLVASGLMAGPTVLFTAGPALQPPRSKRATWLSSG